MQIREPVCSLRKDLETMNYADLLRKYMQLVYDDEGITFLGRIDGNGNYFAGGNPRFTPEELAELKTIESEVAG